MIVFAKEKGITAGKDIALELTALFKELVKTDEQKELVFERGNTLFQAKNATRKCSLSPTPSGMMSLRLAACRTSLPSHSIYCGGYYVEILPENGSTGSIIHGDFVLEDNDFNSPVGGGINAKGAQGLTVRNNKVKHFKSSFVNVKDINKLSSDI